MDWFGPIIGELPNLTGGSVSDLRLAYVPISYPHISLCHLTLFCSQWQCAHVLPHYAHSLPSAYSVVLQLANESQLAMDKALKDKQEAISRLEEHEEQRKPVTANAEVLRLEQQACVWRHYCVLCMRGRVSAVASVH